MHLYFLPKANDLKKLKQLLCPNNPSIIENKLNAIKNLFLLLQRITSSLLNKLQQTIITILLFQINLMSNLLLLAHLLW